MKNKKKVYRSAIENLRAANRLLRRTKWTTGELAVDQDGMECEPGTSNAHSFCALGAIKHIDGPGEEKATRFLRRAAKLEIESRAVIAHNLKDHLLLMEDDDDHIFWVNDSYGYDAVKIMFRRAIKLAQV